jgi:hypothetical protein
MTSPPNIAQFRLRHVFYVVTAAAVILAVSVPFVRRLAPFQQTNLAAFGASYFAGFALMVVLHFGKRAFAFRKLGAIVGTGRVLNLGHRALLLFSFAMLLFSVVTQTWLQCMLRGSAPMLVAVGGCQAGVFTILPFVLLAQQKVWIGEHGLLFGLFYPWQKICVSQSDSEALVLNLRWGQRLRLAFADATRAYVIEQCEKT